MFEAVWTPYYFGISLAVKVDGSNTTPPPPPQGGTPAANQAEQHEYLRLVA